MEYEITFDQLETMEHPNVIDIRTPEQYAYGTYPGAVNIPTEDIKPEMQTAILSPSEISR